MTHPHLWVRITTTGVAIKEACALFVVSGDVSSAGTVGTVYNAQSAKGSHQILELEAAANVHRQVHFGPRGIRCENGLYVTMGTNGDELILIYDPIVVSRPSV